MIAVAHGQRADDELDRAGGAEHVARHRLGGADVHACARASPNTALIAFVSLRSLAGVDVPCALMYSMSAGVEAGVLHRAAHRALRAFALRRRRGEVVRVARRAVADDLGVDARAALLARARALRESRCRAPSPITKPSRVASNGRDAVCGRVVALGERLHVREAADRHRRDGRFRTAGDHRRRRRRTGWCGTRRRSRARSWRRPRRWRSSAPWRWNRIETSPAAMSAMNIGMKNGADLALPALAVDVVLLLERLESADAAADDDAECVPGRTLAVGQVPRPPSPAPPPRWRTARTGSARLASLRSMY